jgi:hypothetical protein
LRIEFGELRETASAPTRYVDENCANRSEFPEFPVLQIAMPDGWGIIENKRNLNLHFFFFTRMQLCCWEPPNGQRDRSTFKVFTRERLPLAKCRICRIRNIHATTKKIVRADCRSKQHWIRTSPIAYFLRLICSDRNSQIRCLHRSNLVCSREIKGKLVSQWRMCSSADDTRHFRASQGRVDVEVPPLELAWGFKVGEPHAGGYYLQL